MLQQLGSREEREPGICICEGRNPESKYDEAITGGTPVLRRAPFGGRKKRVSIFDEQSHYVIENKGSEKRTKPNKADYINQVIENK